MKKIDACKLRRKGGFTLVELIVVLVMLAVLSAVAVPTYLGFVDDNKARQCETHRKALASRLEEMSAMGSTASLTEEVLNSDENGCPAGGRYELDDSPEGSDINSMTITCDKHGSTTVMLKNNSQVTAKSNTETEKKGGEPETGKTEPPEPETSIPKEPKFSIIVHREKENMEVGETQILETSVEVQSDCTPTDNYTWDIPENFEIIGEQNGASIKIKAVSEGLLCAISCSSSAMVADGDPISASANTQVTVNSKATVFNGDIILRGWSSNDINYGLKAEDYGLPSGGTWSGVSPVEFNFDEIKVKDMLKGNSYPITYTVDGQEYKMNVTVVYPVWDYRTAGNQEEIMYLGDGEKEILYTELHPYFATVRDNVEWNVKSQEWDETTGTWVDTDKEIIDFGAQREPISGEVLQKYIKTRAKAAGRVIITASLDDPYDKDARVVPPTKFHGNLFTPTKTVVAKYKMATGVTYDTVVLTPGDSVKIADIMHVTPNEGVDTSNLLYKCWGDYTGKDIVDIDLSTGTITAKKNGVTSATIEIKKQSSPVQQQEWTVSNNCQIVVTNDPTKLSTVTFDSVTVMVGETEEVVKHLIPETASMDGVTFTYRSNDEGVASVSSSGAITGKSSGSVWINVQISVDGNQIVSSGFNVYVLSPKTHINGKEFNVTSWKELREVLIRQSGGTDNAALPSGQLYGAWENGQISYILKKNAELPWDETYNSGMSFGDYLSKYRDQFVKVSTNDVKDCSWANGQWLNPGTVVCKNSEYYVYTGNGTSLDTSWKETEMEQNDLVKIS